jgi:predicted PurR-regulated permease PerM
LNLNPSPDTAARVVTKIALGIGAVIVFYKLSNLILLLFLGSMLAVILGSVCRRIERLGLPRRYAVGLIATALFAIFLSISALLIPAITNQVVSLVNSLPQIRSDFLASVPDRFGFTLYAYSSR